MNCADVEILLADYVDGTLHGEQKTAVEAHLAACGACAELARDAAAAVGFMERVAIVEPPPELVTRLLFEASNGPSRNAVKPSLARRWFGRWLEPVLQPRYVMGMAMTLLSFAMLGRFAGIEVRQLKPSDLDPVNVWLAAEDRVVRLWDRGVKYYRDLRLVYEIQTRFRDWSEQNGAAANTDAPAQPAAGAPAPPGEERK
jgi:anti-sigma factor RsiW